MDRAVIRFLTSGDLGIIQFYIDAPYSQDGEKTFQWKVGADAEAAIKACRNEEIGSEVVRKAGSTLYRELKRHPAVSRELFRDGAPKSIYFQADSASIDDLPWEALHHDKHGFVALTEGWPIGRLQKPALPATKLDYDFFPPVRIMILLSAPSRDPLLRASAFGEWNALYTSLRAARDLLRAKWELTDTEPIDVKVCVGETALKTQIDGIREGWLSTEMLADAISLNELKQNYAPHLLHIFCHGDDSGLTLGSRADWTSKSDGSIDLAIDSISDWLSDKLWLVTLNACGSAGNTSETINFTRRLVMAGVPAAVGMRERIDTFQAELLSRHFYQAVFSRLATLGLNEAHEVDWARLLKPLRREIALYFHKPSNGARTLPPEIAKGCSHWTLPVLYSRADPFRLRRQQGRTPNKLELIAQQQQIEFEMRQIAALRHLDPQDMAKMLGQMDAKLREINRQLGGQL
jgi:hypothetical protein